MAKIERGELFKSVARLRRAERELPGNRDVGAVRATLERSLGETVSPAFAARTLGVSRPALANWIERRAVPVVLTPEGRRAVPVASLLDLYEAVERERAAGRRHVLEAVVLGERSLSERLRPGVLVDGRQAGADPRLASELRSFAYHRAVARRVDRAAADDALVRVRRWREQDRIDPRYAEVWEKVLVKPVSDIRKALEADTQLGRDLRQNSPFAGFLSEAERQRIIEEIG